MALPLDASTGALTAQPTDSTVTNGNARGANAVDLQTTRTSAASVASGTNAVLGGGSGNLASGTSATVAGGAANAASATQSTVGGGTTNTASSANAVVAGGNVNTASGSSSWVPGGTRADTRSHVSRGAWSGGLLAATGDAQSGEFVLRAATTDATVTRLTGDNGAASTTNTVNLPNNGTYLLRLMLAARQTAGVAGTAGDSSVWSVDIGIKRGAAAANTALLGTAQVTRPGYDAATAAWALTIAADTTNGGLALSVTGEASKSINWVCRVLSVEVVG